MVSIKILQRNSILKYSSTTPEAVSRRCSIKRYPERFLKDTCVEVICRPTAGFLGRLGQEILRILVDKNGLKMLPNSKKGYF